MRVVRLLAVCGLLCLSAVLMGGCCGGGCAPSGVDLCRWWDPCASGPDCCPIGDPNDCCDPCGCP